MGNSTWPSHWGTTPPHSQSMGPGEADPISPPSRSRREHGQAEQILVCLGSPVRTSGNDKLRSTAVGECQPGASGRYHVEEGFLGMRPI